MTLSFIIPVYGQWPLLKACLISISAAMPAAGMEYEVLLVDNAAWQAGDAVHTHAPALGQALFGGNFHYFPQPVNLNFAGACNLGCREAKGKYLCFLNSDTVLSPGCMGPLVETLAENPAFFAVGPLLVYPPNPADLTGVERVQHLGITLGPDRKVAHLYENFPTTHPLVQKTRLLQAITAAVFVCEKTRFEALGVFCEDFKNGFEDLDICKAAGQRGWQVGVVPGVKVTHYCGQSTGRGTHDAHNADVLAKRGALDFFHPDFHTLLAEDGYSLTLTPWLNWQVVPDMRKTARLTRTARQASAREIENILLEEPYWLDGWQLCIEKTVLEGRLDYALFLAQLSLSFDEGPMPLSALLDTARKAGDSRMEKQALEALIRYQSPLENRLADLRAIRAFIRASLPSLVPQVDATLDILPVFHQKVYLPFWENIR